MGWEGGRTPNQGGTSPLLIPLPCKAACTSPTLLLLGQDNIFFQKGKKENTTYTKIKVPGDERGQEQDKLQPQAGDIKFSGGDPRSMLLFYNKG